MFWGMRILRSLAVTAFALGASAHLNAQSAPRYSGFDEQIAASARLRPAARAPMQSTVILACPAKKALTITAGAVVGVLLGDIAYVITLPAYNGTNDQNHRRHRAFQLGGFIGMTTFATIYAMRHRCELQLPSSLQSR